ncbi:MAG: hypothetical protein NTU97_04575, partial [Candidatus Magasanikbacteria bacterium]|nr:hypothetical protein [Candidatus Magasanikbacteria bacterium]
VFFSGFFWALALYVRPSEFWWMLALGIFGLVQVKKVWNKKEFIAVICGVLLVGVGFFATQYAFYGNIFGSGYVIPQSSGEAGVVFSGPQGINFWQAIILPFGFHPLTAIKTFVKYFFVLFRPWLWLSFAGFSLLFFNRFKSKQTGEEVGVNNFKYVAVWFLLSLYILIFYGSWEFFDNLAMTPSIGTSYVRYFLPIYVFSLPLAAYFLVKLWFLNKVVSKFLVILLALLLLGASFGEVYLKLDGLQQVKINVKQYQEWQEKIYQLTEPESVIVTRYADKYLFPGRKVISGWQNDEQVTAIINLVKDGDHVYFYDLKLDPATEDSFRQKLLLGGVDLKEVVASWDDLELRKIGPR